jgi:hypothetical protein
MQHIGRRIDFRAHCPSPKALELVHANAHMSLGAEIEVAALQRTRATSSQPGDVVEIRDRYDQACDSRAAYLTVRRLSADDLPALRSGNNIERQLLSFVKAMHPGAFDRTDLRPVRSRSGEKSVSPTRERDEANSFGRSSIGAECSIVVWTARFRSKIRGELVGEPWHVAPVIGG